MSFAADRGTDEYTQALSGEGEYWDSFVATRLLRGEIRGSLDWRLNLTQFRFNHGWRPLCLGTASINFRLSEIHYVLTHAVPRPGARVLDLGCGSGWLSLELARRGAHVTALDISPANLALARHLASTNARNFPYLYQRFAGLPCHLEQFGSVEYSYADLNTVDLPHAEFDAVVVWDALHHVANLERLLEHVRHALKPGGIFIGVDHAFATRRTELFNLGALPLLNDLSSWITEHDPTWLYESVNRHARQLDLGLMSIDYDPTPVPGFAPFLEELRAELLELVRSTGDGQSSAQSAAQTGVSEESPFEDVSAIRLMRVLLSEFHANCFTTLCPYIMPEKYIPAYRAEAERLFQHYLAAFLMKIGEQAINTGQADGQWFLFHLTPDKPPHHEVEKALNALTWQTMREEQLAYIAHLETEVQRKNAALSELTERLIRREQELVQARAPKLPWKRARRQ